MRYVFVKHPKVPVYLNDISSMIADKSIAQAYKPSLIRASGSPFVFVKRKRRGKDQGYEDLPDQKQEKKKQEDNFKNVDIRA